MIRRAALSLFLAAVSVVLAAGNVVWAASVSDVEALIAATASQSRAERIGNISNYFVGTDYLLGNLGEGPEGKYDRKPLYRFDAFDCTTYVETVISLSRSKNFGQFKKLMNHIRYKKGKIDFTTRNHFPEIDWIPNNTKAGFIRDVTEKIGGVHVSWAFALIDKPNWYSMLPASSIARNDLDEDQRAVLLNELHGEGRRFQRKLSVLPFLDIAFLLGTPEGQAALEKIPSGSIINIVRPNWDLVKIAGTHMNISHQGFAVRINGELYLRHASPSGSAKVQTVLLTDYLRKFLNHPTIKGINVDSIR